MIPYVMFGVHPLFGDYVDAIHSRGGYLARVVLNVPEPDRPRGQRFEDSLDKYRDWMMQQGTPCQVQVLWIDAYQYCSQESAVLGFRGLKVLPLVARVKARFGIQFDSLIHADAHVSPMADLGEGVFVGAGTVVAPNAKIGDFALLNRGVTVGHDAALARCTVVSPSAALASYTHVEEGAVIGMGATVLENLTIGREAYVAAGAVVLQNVDPRRMVAGVPARVKKHL